MARTVHYIPYRGKLGRTPDRAFKMPNKGIKSVNFADDMQVEIAQRAILDLKKKKQPVAESLLQLLSACIKPHNNTQILRFNRLFRKAIGNNPGVKKKFLKELSAHMEKLAFNPTSQFSFSGRHKELDEKLFRFLASRALAPKRFLEVGGAFQSQRYHNTPAAQTTLEAKQFFDERGLKMEYFATDIVLIERADQRRLLGEGVKAIQWDYAKKGNVPGRIGKFGLIRILNVEEHQTPGQFHATISNLFDILEPGGLLIINHPIGHGNKAQIFQKKPSQKGDRLIKIGAI